MITWYHRVTIYSQGRKVNGWVYKGSKALGREEAKSYLTRWKVKDPAITVEFIDAELLGKSWQRFWGPSAWVVAVALVAVFLLRVWASLDGVL